MDRRLDASYWNDRYEQGQIGWDLGDISSPLKAYFEQLTDKEIKILIPGGGNAYEAEFLWKNGFKNTYLLDYAPKALENFAKRNPDFPKDQLIQDDFFKHAGQYDLIVEQTFFCALDPSLREDYGKQVANLLKPNGKVIGLLFNKEFQGGPPFGGNKEEYYSYFFPNFSKVELKDCYNSIEPRKDSELFIKLTR